MDLSVENFLIQQQALLDSVVKDPSHRNYWSVFQKLKKIIADNDLLKVEHNFKISLLSSFTIDPLAAYLDVDCRSIGLLPHVFVGPFNQYQQEIINDASSFHAFGSSLIIFFIQLESLVDSMFRANFPLMSKEAKQDEIDRIYALITDLLKSLMSKTKALIIFSNFVVPTFSPLGIMDNKVDIGYKKFYSLLNDKLEVFAKDFSQIFIFDLDASVAKFGKNNYLNYPMYYRGSFLFDEKVLPIISYELMGFIKAFKGKNRKALVLDLDNTLWGGVIGEEGSDGIKLNINHPGNNFYDFQKTILSLYNRGIIIALNSKNDQSYALEVFQKHPYMLLKEKHLGAFRINWLDKATNIINLAEDLNIGVDSLVFLDDNPVERDRVKTSAPEVFTVDMPDNPSFYRKTLEDLNDFNTLSLTSEDLQRGEMYYARRKRQDLESNVQSMDDFIQSLELEVIFKKADSFTLPRITSLINKTNQFNLTTKRFTEPEIQGIVNGNDILIYSLQVKDKFGDEGIVGVAMISRVQKTSWKIINLLMSCRVIGRKIETAFLTKILRLAHGENVFVVEGDYIPTKKNGLVKDFYVNHNFTKIAENLDGSSTWQINTTDLSLDYPSFLKIVED